MRDSIDHILLITLDQWRGDCINFDNVDKMGKKKFPIENPFFSEFAKEGVCFHNHYSVAAPCGPARASLLSGLYGHTHQAMRNGTPLDDGFTNIARELKKADISPCLIGYSDITLDPRIYGLNHPSYKDFEGVLPGLEMVMRLDDDLSEWISSLRSKGYGEIIKSSDWDVFLPDEKSLSEHPDKPYYWHPAKYGSDISNSAVVTDCALDFYKKNKANKTFLNLTYISPHPPYICPPEYHDKYHKDDMIAPLTYDKNVEKLHPYIQASLKFSGRYKSAIGLEKRFDELTEADILQMRATYLGMINEAEQHVARLIDGLKETGLYDKTLIIITSDHGDMLGDYGIGGKSGFWDASYHIPLIIRDPRKGADAARGTHISEFTESIDIMPTILEAVDLPVPRQCQGASLSPFLQGDKPARWRNAVCFEYNFSDPDYQLFENFLNLSSEQGHMLTYRDNEYKMVCFAGLPDMLFDLTNDSNCAHDIANDMSYAQVKADLYQKIMKFRLNTDNKNLSHYIAGRQLVQDGEKKLFIGNDDALSAVRPAN